METRTRRAHRGRREMIVLIMMGGADDDVDDDDNVECWLGVDADDALLVFFTLFTTFLMTLLTLNSRYRIAVMVNTMAG